MSLRRRLSDRLYDLAWRLDPGTHDALTAAIDANKQAQAEMQDAIASLKAELERDTDRVIANLAAYERAKPERGGTIDL